MEKAAMSDVWTLCREATGVSIHGTLLIWPPRLWMIFTSGEALFWAPLVVAMTLLRLLTPFKTVVSTRWEAEPCCKSTYSSHFLIPSSAICMLHCWWIPTIQHFGEINYGCLCSVNMKVYIIGGDGTQKGANVIHEACNFSPPCCGLLSSFCFN
jgi:hypothetical protein